MFSGSENIAHHVPICRATSPATGIAAEAENDVAVPIKADSMIEIAAYRLKQYDKVLRAVRNVLPFPLEEEAYREIEMIYGESGIVAAYEKIVERLEKYAESQPVGFHDMAFRYIVANQLDKAMDWVEKGFEMHDPLMTYITTPARYFDRLFGDSRFIAVCEKMHLPLPV